MKWFVAGDPLRGLATLGIVAVHAGSAALNATGAGVRYAGEGGRIEAYGEVAGSLQVSGAFGVWVFFVLSGYLIGRPFVRSAIEGGPRPSIAQFARKRTLRILPAYWTVLTIVIVFMVCLTTSAEISSARAVGLYALVINGDNPLSAWTAHMWTLEAEAMFYVALPVMALLCAPLLRRLPTPGARGLAIGVPCVAWTCATPFGFGEAMGVEWLTVFRFFAAGIALAAIEPFALPRVAGHNRWSGTATYLFAGAVVCLLVLPPLRYLVGGSLAGGVGGGLLDLACDIAVASVVGGALLRQWAGGACWRAVDNGFTRWLGTRSYSFYLVHYALVFELSLLIAKAGWGYKVTLAVLLPAVISASGVLAEVLYQTVERPFLSLKTRSADADAPEPAVIGARPAEG